MAALCIRAPAGGSGSAAAADPLVIHGRVAARNLRLARRRSRRRRLEDQADAVEAVAFAGRGRPIVEDVTEMATAAVAMYLRPYREKAPVGLSCNGVGQRLPKRGPTGAAIELCLG